MRKSEFLQELKDALQGEVSDRVLQENLRYYDNYISQETSAGRDEEEVIEEIGGPRLIARTIIDSSEAAGDMPGQNEGYYESQGSGYRQQESRGSSGFHYFDLNKWYWKLLLLVVVGLLMFLVITVLGGIFALLMRFAGPLILIWLIYTFIKGMKR